jgi:hypothetical protein
MSATTRRPARGQTEHQYAYLLQQESTSECGLLSGGRRIAHSWIGGGASSSVACIGPSRAFGSLASGRRS